VRVNFLCGFFFRSSQRLDVRTPGRLLLRSLKLIARQEPFFDIFKSP
jgi:hypothetical protein